MHYKIGVTCVYNGHILIAHQHYLPLLIDISTHVFRAEFEGYCDSGMRGLFQ